jgi:hypothetical protein
MRVATEGGRGEIKQPVRAARAEGLQMSREAIIGIRVAEIALQIIQMGRERAPFIVVNLADLAGFDGGAVHALAKGFRRQGLAGNAQ